MQTVGCRDRRTGPHASDHQPLTPHHYPSMLYAVAFSANGKLLATGDKVGHVAIWDVATGEKLAVGGIGQIGNIDHLGGPSRVEIFNWREGRKLHEIEDEKLKGLVEQLAFHESGAWLLASGGDNNGFVTLYDRETGKLLHQAKAPMHVHAFAFEDCARLYTVGHEKVAVWEFGT